MHYNPYFANLNIAMPPPLTTAGQVEYQDGTKPTVDQMATDVAAFLVWTAEPNLEARRAAGFAVVIFLLFGTVLGYFAYRQLWYEAKRTVRRTGPSTLKTRARADARSLRRASRADNSARGRLPGRSGAQLVFTLVRIAFGRCEMRIPYVSLLAAGALALGGCADYYGYGGGLGYNGYYGGYGYGSPYYGGGYYSGYEYASPVRTAGTTTSIILAPASMFTTRIAGRTR